MVFAVQMLNRPGKPGAILASFRLTSEKPVVRAHLRPTKFVQLNDLFRTLIGDLETIAGNHRCTHQGVGRVP
jgi:hypothetical protein